MEVEREVIVCGCGSDEHMLVLEQWEYIREDWGRYVHGIVDGPELFTIAMHLPRTTFFGRLKYAFKYLFNKHDGGFTDMFITLGSAGKILAFIEREVAEYKATVEGLVGSAQSEVDATS